MVYFDKLVKALSFHNGNFYDRKNQGFVNVEQKERQELMAEKDGFFDEKILEYRKRARDEKYCSLETGMYIKDEFIQFERKVIFQEKMSIILPTTFVDLPSNIAKLKYISEQRPQIIKTSLDTTVNLGFTMTDIEIHPEQVEALCKQAKSALKRVNPAIIFYEGQVESDLSLGWFEFKSYGIDSNAYNLMFVTIIKGKMLHGVFICNYDDALEWRDAARQMMHSIRDISKEEKDA